MRKLVVSNIMSLDGHFEGPGRNVMALPMDGFFDEHNLERLRTADTLSRAFPSLVDRQDSWARCES